VVPGTWNRPGWSAPGEANDIKGAFDRVGPATGADAGQCQSTNGGAGALFTGPNFGEWSQGAVALLATPRRDACLCSPRRGMAIEDAAVLAKLSAITPATTSRVSRPP